MHSLWCDDVSQEAHTAFMQLTLLCLYVELVLQQSLKKLAYMLDMLRDGVGENQNVMEIHKQILVKHIT